MSQADSNIPTIDPQKEPEYVGAFSGLSAEWCQNYIGETRDEIEKCGNEATHTVVMASGSGAHEIAMCDECGEPEDAEVRTEREWTGRVIDQ